LAAAPLKTDLLVSAPAADPAAAHRLLTLGWRPGAPVRVIRRTGGGARVIALSGARVAIGHQLAQTLRVSLAPNELAGVDWGTEVASPVTAALAPVVAG
jgi:ferrous iron transport protein A